MQQWLVGTLQDFKLSHSESLELRELLPKLATDEIAFVRNHAFLLARDQVDVGGTNAVATLIWLEKIIKNIDNFRAAHARFMVNMKPRDKFSYGEGMLDFMRGVK